MEPEKKPNLVEIVDELERATKTDEGLSREDGTVVDAEGQIIKLGEELSAGEVFYGNPVPLPDDLLSPKD